MTNLKCLITQRSQDNHNNNGKLLQGPVMLIDHRLFSFALCESQIYYFNKQSISELKHAIIYVIRKYIHYSVKISFKILKKWTSVELQEVIIC